MDFEQALTTTHKLSDLYNPLINSKRIYEENVPVLITLRNLHGPIGAKATLRPIMHAPTRELLGVPRYTEEEKRRVNFVVDKRAKLIVESGFTFNLNDEAERQNWNWAQYSPLIAETREQGMMSPQAMFYVENEARDLSLRQTKADLLWSAEKLVRDWKPNERMNRARLLGQDLSHHTPEEVLLFLVDKARSSALDAQAILDVENDAYREQRLKLLRWKDAGIVETKNGSFYFGDIRIGVDDRSALGYILQRENHDVVESMQARYERLRKPNLSGHVDVPVRGGAGLRASSTAVNPPQVPPAAPASGLTLERVAQLAPLGYAQLEAQLGPEMFAYLQENPDPEVLKQVVAGEMKLRLARAQQALIPEPTSPVPPAPVPRAEQLAQEQARLALAGAGTTDADGDTDGDENLLGSEHVPLDEQPDAPAPGGDAILGDSAPAEAPAVAPKPVSAPEGVDVGAIGPLLTRPGAGQPSLASVKAGARSGGKFKKATPTEPTA